MVIFYCDPTIDWATLLKRNPASCNPECRKCNDFAFILHLIVGICVIKTVMHHNFKISILGLSVKENSGQVALGKSCISGNV